MRIRAFTQDDGHILCTEDQILSECVAYTALLQKVYADFGFTRIIYKLATRPEKRVGADDLGVSPHEARLARAYGYVFQAPALFPWRTVLANVTLPLQIQGRSKADSKAIALEHLARVGLIGFEQKYPWQLSGGMQQRVSIARALSFEPRILMMDEPFGALDEITRDRLNEQLQQLWQRERRTVVFVTHSIAEAVYLATRIVVMSPRPGRIVEDCRVDLTRPRTLDTMASPAFVDACQHLRRHFVT